MPKKTETGAAPDTAVVLAEPPVDACRLAEENTRLAEENRRLRESERRREVAYFLAELREEGRLTPALERAGVEEALVQAEESSLPVNFPDGRQVPLATVLRELLKALPVSLIRGELAGTASPAPELSTLEREVAQALGLSEREYMEISCAE